MPNGNKSVFGSGAVTAALFGVVAYALGLGWLGAVLGSVAVGAVVAWGVHRSNLSRIAMPAPALLTAGVLGLAAMAVALYTTWDPSGAEWIAVVLVGMVMLANIGMGLRAITNGSERRR